MRVTQTTFSTSFYIVGGTVRRYVERQADTELYDNLKQGQFCYAPIRKFQKPIDADRPGNFWTLCIAYHQWKTEFELQMGRRMQ